MTVEKDFELGDINVSSEDSDGEDVDQKEKDKRHKKLLNDLDETLGIRKKRQYNTSRSEPSNDISEYNWSASAEKVSLQDLVGSLDSKCQSVAKLKKKLGKMESKTKVLEKPLEKVERERVERTVAYQETAKDISKWYATIQKNREAEHLSFPLNSYKPPPVSTRNMAIDFKPQNEMEEEISKILSGSKHLLERKDMELTEAEEKALQEIDLEEALERRKELQKSRALQSYYEAKCRRAKKIKSKKYHRMLKKEQQKEFSKVDLEKLSKENPELFQSELEKAEKMRAKERANLRHRNTSKWAKNLITRGHKTKEDQERIREQLRISRELTDHKKADESDSNEDIENNLDNGKLDTELNLLKGTANDENPWLLGDSSVEKSKAGSVDSSSSFKKLRPIVTSESQVPEEDGKDVDFSSNDEWDDAGKNVAIPKKKKSVKKNKMKASKLKKKSHSKDSGKVDCGDDDSLESDQEYEGLEKGKQHLDDTETNISDEKSKGKSANSKKTAKVTNPKKRSPSDILKSESNVLELDNAMDSSDDEEIIFDNTEQAMNIREAFANDDVIGDFVREKSDVVEGSKPKQVDMTIPGWGEWGGPGLDVSKKKRKLFTKEVGPAPKRKDDGISNLIINENPNKYLAAHQVSSVPFPYRNKDEFQRSIRQPIGEHWNTPSVHQKLIEPRVQTTPGATIDPMKATRRMKKKFKNAAIDKK